MSTVKNRLFSARKKLKQNCNQTIEDYLSNQRPSMNDIFARKIEQIIEAACADDLATVRQLLQQNSDLVNAQDSNIHTTALHCSAHRGYYNIVKLLVESGADVNTKEGNYSKSTPLHWAATGGHLEITKLLVEKDAKLDAVDDWNNLTPLGWASIIRYDHGDCPLGKQHREIQEYLLHCGAKLDIFTAIAYVTG